MGRDALIFEGKTLDDAVRKGLESLGLSRAEVMITMVEEGSGGFLGIGSRPYRVKVMPRPGGPIGDAGEPAGREGARRRGGRPRPEREVRGRRDGRGGRVAGADSGRGPRRDRPDRPPRPERPERPQPVEREVRAEDDTGVSVGERSSGAPADRSGRRRGGRGGPRGGPGRSGSGRSGSGRGESFEERQPSARGPAASAPNARPQQEWLERSAATAERGETMDSESRAPEEAGLSATDLAAAAKRLTEELLRHMGFEATVTATAEGDRVDVAVSLEESEELLTGGKGEVRVALQHLLNLMLNRGRRARYHLQLEINDFWQSREEELRRLARELADEAVTNHSEVVTEYLNAQERRVVHVTLKEDSRIKTYALGTGLIKRVAVAPADFPDQARPEG